ncbi:MAG: transcriptional repressor [Hyphomicrobiales bacterium]
MSTHHAFPASGHDHGACTADLLARAERICTRRGSRLTPLRREVLEVVAESHEAAGAYEIIERMARHGPRPAPMTVYRALEFLASHDLVHKIESRNAFVACTSHHAEGAAVLLVCERCGQVAELSAGPLVENVRAQAAATGFKPSRLVAEVLGLCAACAGGAPS